MKAEARRDRVIAIVAAAQQAQLLAGLGGWRTEGRRPTLKTPLWLLHRNMLIVILQVASDKPGRREVPRVMFCAGGLRQARKRRDEALRGCGLREGRTAANTSWVEGNGAAPLRA